MSDQTSDCVVGANGCPSVASQLPITFESTGFKVGGVKTRCSNCGFMLYGDQLFGHLQSNGANVSVLEATGVCPVCKSRVKLFARFHSDYRVTLLGQHGWQVFEVQKPSKASVAFHNWWLRIRGKARHA